MKRELGAAAQAEDEGQAGGENPLLPIARHMREAQQRITANDSSPKTQAVQKQIIDDLQKLLESARKCCGGCKAGQCNSPQTANRDPATQPKITDKPGVNPGKSQTPGRRPTDKSQEGVRKAEDHKAKIHAMFENLLKQPWGQLPPHEREMLLQISGEDFLPEYRAMIEDYFRRLSEESAKSSAERQP
ncbi:MAG: hypothetical protein ABSG68_04750 [Thermoguttaceae bacterium]